MKTKILFFIISLFSLATFSQPYERIVIDSIPSTVDGFVKMRNNLAKSPQGGAAIFLVALKVYAEYPELGLKFIILTVDKSRLTQGNVYKGYDLPVSQKRLLKNQIERYPYLPNAYFIGANEKNNYTPTTPLTYKMKIKNIGGKTKVFVFSEVTSSDRPITMQKNSKGIWKAENWSSILVGIKKPETEDDDL